MSAELKWNIEEAITLCRVAESICPRFGCHVALTGGLLYRSGERKDCDLVFYRVRQTEQIDIAGLFGALSAVGLNKKSGFGWCYKAEYLGKPVDFLFPEEVGGDPLAKSKLKPSGE